MLLGTWEKKISILMTIENLIMTENISFVCIVFEMLNRIYLSMHYIFSMSQHILFHLCFTFNGYDVMTGFWTNINIDICVQHFWNLNRMCVQCLSLHFFFYQNLVLSSIHQPSCHKPKTFFYLNFWICCFYCAHK